LVQLGRQIWTNFVFKIEIESLLHCRLLAFFDVNLQVF
jgi:hypothetical protein